jgi:hypothetical protein
LEFNTLVLRSEPGDKIYKTMFFSGKATFEITSSVKKKFCPANAEGRLRLPPAEFMAALPQMNAVWALNLWPNFRSDQCGRPPPAGEWAARQNISFAIKFGTGTMRDSKKQSEFTPAVISRRSRHKAS